MTHDFGQSLGNYPELNEQEKSDWRMAVVRGDIEKPREKGAPKFLIEIRTGTGKEFFGFLEVSRYFIGDGNVYIPLSGSRGLIGTLAEQNKGLLRSSEDFGLVFSEKVGDIEFSGITAGADYCFTFHHSGFRSAPDDYASGYFSSIAEYLKVFNRSLGQLGWQIKPVSVVKFAPL